MLKSKLFLIDGNSFCYRAYYAIPELSTSNGRPTNAIYGFLNMLRKIIKEEEPQYLAFAFDLKGPTFRHKIFDQYKIKRRPMPEDLVEQMPTIKEIIQAYNIPIFEKEGFEADDLLATLVSRLKNPELEIYIVTGDKDALQLVKEGICVYNPYHKERKVYNREDVRTRFGIEPELIPDFLALVGDETDNIPGLKGMGEKTARSLLRQFKSLARLQSHLGEIKNEPLRELLERNREQLRLNWELALLKKDIPIRVNLGELKIKEPQKDKLIRIFKELEFRGLLKELIKDQNKNISLDINYIENKNEFDVLIEEIKQKKIFAFDVYPGSINGRGEARNFALSLYYGQGHPFIIRFGSDGSEINPGDLSGLFGDEVSLKICYDLKGVKSFFVRQNLFLVRNVFDIMLAAYLVNPSCPSYNLEDIAFEYLSYYPSYLVRSLDESVSRIAESVKIIFELYKILSRDLKEKDLLELYKKVELPLVEVLFSMENKGVYLDIHFLDKLAEELNYRIETLKKDIIQVAGRSFNLDSPKQMSQIFFTDLKLPVIKRGKTGPSTDEEVLVKLSAIHKLPKLILEYRELAKLKSTYVDNLRKMVNPETGRIHTSFNQVGTQTGRLSSSHPNLQNIPIKTEFGRQIRKAIASPDKRHLLLSADYSQIELRILAHLSDDESLLAAFKNDLDIHTHTATIIFRLPQERIDARMRNIAKTVNFGIIYGMSPFGLAKELNIEASQAEGFIKSYFERYPKVKVYMDSKIKEAQDMGYVTTLLNRRRYIAGINSPNPNIRQFAQRTAVNTPVQGSAADIIKLAMLKLHERISLAHIDAGLILQIHDELLFEFSGDYLEELVKIVREEMENVVKLKIPLKVSLKVGPNWLEMKPV